METRYSLQTCETPRAPRSDTPPENPALSQTYRSGKISEHALMLQSHDDSIRFLREWQRDSKRQTDDTTRTLQETRLTLERLCAAFEATKESVEKLGDIVDNLREDLAEFTPPARKADNQQTKSAIASLSDYLSPKTLAIIFVSLAFGVTTSLVSTCSPAASAEVSRSISAAVSASPLPTPHQLRAP